MTDSVHVKPDKGKWTPTNATCFVRKLRGAKMLNITTKLIRKGNYTLEVAAEQWFIASKQVWLTLMCCISFISTLTLLKFACYKECPNMRGFDGGPQLWTCREQGRDWTAIESPDEAENTWVKGWGRQVNNTCFHCSRRNGG